MGKENVILLTIKANLDSIFLNHSMTIGIILRASEGDYNHGKSDDY